MVKRIALTGATGYVGRALVHRLSRETGYHLTVITRDKAAAQRLFGDQVALCCDHDEWLGAPPPAGRVDVLLHLGFARPHHGEGEIARSLAFTARLFAHAAAQGTGAIVYVSSRSVYGFASAPPWTEASPVAPVSAYGQAKLEGERLLRAVKESHPEVMLTSIRLGTVSGGSAGLVDVFVLSRFVKQALRGEPIQIKGGTQEFDIIDIGDAVDGLVAVLRSVPEGWSGVYNLSSAGSYNIVMLAELCVQIASRHNGGVRSPILVSQEEVNLRYGMDNSLLCRDFGWRPTRKLEETVESLVRYYLRRIPGCGQE